MAEGANLEEVTRWPCLTGLKPAEISVLIPCWHGEATISGALDSVEAQEGLPEHVGVETVVVVDGRQEDRQAIAHWVESKGPSRRWAITMVFLAENRGAGGARKAGYRHCSGAFLALLDDDDVWDPRKLSLQWDWHQTHPERIASGHGYERTPKNHEVDFRRLLIGGYHLHNSTVMIRRSLWPYQPEPYRFSEDWLMLIMIAKLQPINVLPYKFGGRSAAAPPPTADAYSLSRQRRKLRLGKISAARVLIARGKLNSIWLPSLVAWSLLLALRRCLLDYWHSARPGAASAE
jgi:glycosyltransferase involved in cell wall biosynthesis